MDNYIKKYLREQLLNEAISDVMYHFTYTGRAISILKSDQINLTPTLGRSADQSINGGKLYYLSLSTTRSALDGYGNTITNNGVRLTLDGRAISTNKHVKNTKVDYWQTTRNPSDGTIKDEMEERIISDENSLKPATQYIRMVEIINGTPNHLWEIKMLCDDLGIPVYAYDDVKYYTMSAKHKAITIKKPEGYEASNRVYSDSDMSDVIALMCYGEPAVESTLREGLKDLGVGAIAIDRWINNSKDRVLDFIRMKDYMGDLSSTINGHVDNNKGNPNEFTRFIIHEFGKELKKHNLSTVKEYIEHKIYLGKKTDAQFKEELKRYLLDHLHTALESEMETLSRMGYEYNEERYDDLSKFPLVSNFMKEKYSILYKHVIKVVDAHDESMGRNAWAIAVNLDRNELNKLVGCEMEHPQFNQFSENLGEHVDEDMYYALMSLVSSISWAVGDKIKEIEEERDNQWS